MSHGDIVAQFGDAVRAAGLRPNYIPTDGNICRCSVEHSRRRDNGWLVLHLNAGDRAFGAFGNWGTGEKHTWVQGGDIRSLSPEERRKLDEAIERKRATRAAEEKVSHDRAAARALAMWNAASPAPDSHGYLRRKHVRGIGLGGRDAARDQSRTRQDTR